MKGKQDKATADYHRGVATADALMAIFGLKRVETVVPRHKQKKTGRAK